MPPKVQLKDIEIANLKYSYGDDAFKESYDADQMSDKKFSNIEKFFYRQHFRSMMSFDVTGVNEFLSQLMSEPTTFKRKAVKLNEKGEPEKDELGNQVYAEETLTLSDKDQKYIELCGSHSKIFDEFNRKGAEHYHLQAFCEANGITYKQIVFAAQNPESEEGKAIKARMLEVKKSMLEAVFCDDLAESENKIIDFYTKYLVSQARMIAEYSAKEHITNAELQELSAHVGGYQSVLFQTLSIGKQSGPQKEYGDKFVKRINKNLASKGYNFTLGSISRLGTLTNFINQANVGTVSLMDKKNVESKISQIRGTYLYKVAGIIPANETARRYLKDLGNGNVFQNLAKISEAAFEKNYYNKAARDEILENGFDDGSTAGYEILVDNALGIFNDELGGERQTQRLGSTLTVVAIERALSKRLGEKGLIDEDTVKFMDKNLDFIENAIKNSKNNTEKINAIRTFQVNMAGVIDELSKSEYEHDQYSIELLNHAKMLFKAAVFEREVILNPDLLRRREDAEKSILELREEDLLKTDAERDAEFKKLLAERRDINLKSIAKSNPLNYRATIDNALNGVDKLAFKAALKRYRLDGQNYTPAVSNATNLLWNGVMQGKSILMLQADPAIVIPEIKDCMPVLFKAAQTDLRNSGSIAKLSDELISAAEKPKIDLDELRTFAKSSGLPLIGKRKKAAQDQLRRMYAQKVKASAKDTKFGPASAHRSIEIALSKPGLTEAEKYAIANSSTTLDGRIEIAKRLVEEVRNIDLDSLRSLTPEQYLRNYEQYEYIRRACFDLSYLDSAEVSSAVFGTGEKETYKNYATDLQRTWNLLDGRLSLLMDPASQIIDADQLDDEQLVSLMGATSAGMFGIKVSENQFLAKNREVDIAKAATDKAAYELARNRRWADAFKVKPGVTLAEIHFIDNAFSPDGPGPEVLYPYAVAEINRVFLNKDGLDLTTPLNFAYMRKLADVATAILPYIKSSDMMLDEFDVQIVEMASKYRNSRDVIDNAEIYISNMAMNDPSVSNLELYFNLYGKEMADSMIKANDIKYFVLGTEDTLPSARNRKAISDLTDLFYDKTREILKIGGSFVDEHKLMCGADSLADARNRIQDYYNKLGKRVSQNTVKTVLDNLPQLYMAAKKDQAAYDERYAKFYEMLNNAEYPELDSRRRKDIEDIAAKNGIKTFGKEHEEEYRRNREILRQGTINKNISRTTNLNVEKSPFRPFLTMMGYPGITQEEKSVIKAGHKRYTPERAKAYDVVLNKMAELDLSIIDENLSIEDHIHNFDKLSPITNLFWDYQFLFSEMDADIASGYYKCDPEKLAAIKAFAKVVSDKTTKLETLFDLYEQPESMIIDFESIDNDKAMELYGNLIEYGKAINPSFITNIVAIQNAPNAPMSQVIEAKLHMDLAAGKPVGQAIDSMLSSTIRDIKHAYTVASKDGASNEVKEASKNAITEGITKAVFLCGIRAQEKMLTSHSKIKEYLSPAKMKESMDKLRPIMSKVVEGISPKEFSETIKTGKFSKELLDKVNKSFTEKLKDYPELVNGKGEEIKKAIDENIIPGPVKQ